MKAVEIRELVKDYGNCRAISGTSFEVNEGDVFGLIGPNGAGKTTALRVVATLLQITSGSVAVVPGP
jgi:ABC-2 type transport system ATP-binding protein